MVARDGMVCLNEIKSLGLGLSEGKSIDDQETSLEYSATKGHARWTENVLVMIPVRLGIETNVSTEGA